MTLGQLIKTERNKRGWSIRDLADQIDNICRHQYLSLLEKDPVSKKSGDPIKPRREILEALAKAFHLPVHTVLHAAGYLGPIIDIDDEARELLGYFKGLDEEMRAYIMTITRAVYERGQGKTGKLLKLERQKVEDTPVIILENETD